MSLEIEITDGARFCNDVDRTRALLAAEKVLAGFDALSCADAFELAIEAGVDPREHGIYAAIWDDAQSAADIALTEGWADPNGAGCFLRLA